MRYVVNDTVLSYEAVGAREKGKAEVLLAAADDLTAGDWADQGFTIEKLFDDDTFLTFQKEVTSLLISLWRKAGLPVPDGFRLDQYHTLVDSWATHLKAVDQTRLLQVGEMPLGVKAIEDRISGICGVPLQALNPFDGQSVFHFRVIRPNSTDNNPLHRDVWLEDYSNCINLYIPVAGSDERSSLVLLPGSHRWPESAVERTVGGANINGVQFNVPAVTAIDHPHTVARPDPKLNEVLVFSPYLVHGGAVNLNNDRTRISIELRLWRRR